VGAVFGDVAKGHVGPGCDERSHARLADAAGSACDHDAFAFEGPHVVAGGWVDGVVVVECCGGHGVG
jgi:hypothetical protein